LKARPTPGFRVSAAKGLRPVYVTPSPNPFPRGRGSAAEAAGVGFQPPNIADAPAGA
jgi:hypothetical protein